VGHSDDALDMESKRHRSFVGAVQSNAGERGWFFGHFMTEPLLRSDLVEVAWQSIPNMTPAAEQRHVHRRTVEINVVLRGTVQLKIDDVEHDLRKGDFYVVWPESVVSDITTDADAEVLVVRAPSVENDKFIVTD
jgi:mannose-6-phosphate isomerase-like protein (cupin superfamily)